MMPNIIDELNLSVYEYRVYSHLKRVSGETSCCFKSNKEIAAKCNMSESKYREVKKRLATYKHPLLLGKTLIRVTVREKSHKGEDTSLITLTNIWPENDAYFRNSNNSYGCHDMAEGVPPHGTKEYPYKNIKRNHQRKETDKVIRPEKEDDDFLFEKKIKEVCKLEPTPYVIAHVEQAYEKHRKEIIHLNAWLKEVVKNAIEQEKRQLQSEGKASKRIEWAKQMTEINPNNWFYDYKQQILAYFSGGQEYKYAINGNDDFWEKKLNEEMYLPGTC